MTLTKTSQTQLNNSKLSSKSQLSDSESFCSSFSRSGNQILGTTTGFASTPINIDLQPTLIKKLENNENRYALQKIAQSYHPESRICSCMKTINVGHDNIELHYDDETRHAHYRNLMRCDDVWKCAVCSDRMTSRRAEEIRQAYAYAVETLGFRVLMVTYTMRHDKFQTLEENVKAMREARRKMRSGRAWQNFKRKYGYIGCISSLEPPYNRDTGWHVHVHELMFLDPKKADFEIDVEDRKLEKWLDGELSSWWIESLAKVGRSANLKNGIDVTATDKDICEYIQKYGHLPKSETWDVALEISKSMNKTNSDSLHPFTILARSDNQLIEDLKRKQYRALWHEYANAMSDKSQIYWTVGLKELLQIEVVDDESEIQEKGQFVFGVSRDAWRDIVYLNKRAELLNKVIVWRGDFEKILGYVQMLQKDASFDRKKREYWRRFNENTT